MFPGIPFSLSLQFLLRTNETFLEMFLFHGKMSDLVIKDRDAAFRSFKICGSFLEFTVSIANVPMQFPNFIILVFNLVSQPPNLAGMSGAVLNSQKITHLCFILAARSVKIIDVNFELIATLELA